MYNKIPFSIPTFLGFRRITSGAGRLSEMDILYHDGEGDSDCDDSHDEDNAAHKQQQQQNHRESSSGGGGATGVPGANAGGAFDGRGVKPSSFRDGRGSGGGASVTFSEDRSGGGSGGRVGWKDGGATGEGGGGGGGGGRAKGDSVSGLTPAPPRVYKSIGGVCYSGWVFVVVVRR